MRRIHDYHRSPPRDWQTVVTLPVGEEIEGYGYEFADFALDDDEPIPAAADARYTCVFFRGPERGGKYYDSTCVYLSPSC